MNRIVYFLMLYGLWMLLTWTADVQNLVIGALAVLAVTFLTGHLFFARALGVLHPRRIFWFVVFLVVFIVHMIRANLDVAYRVLHLNVPIRPGIVKVTTSLTGDLAVTMLANAITLTPGTLTVDVIGNTLFIHWIHVTEDDPARQNDIIVRRFETILGKVFQ